MTKQCALNIGDEAELMSSSYDSGHVVARGKIVGYVDDDRDTYEGFGIFMVTEEIEHHSGLYWGRNMFDEDKYRYVTTNKEMAKGGYEIVRPVIHIINTEGFI